MENDIQNIDFIPQKIKEFAYQPNPLATKVTSDLAKVKLRIKNLNKLKLNE